MCISPKLLPSLLVTLLLCLAGKLLAGNGPHNWLVVYDPEDPHGVSIARYYQAAREVPESNLIAYSFASQGVAIPNRIQRSEGWDLVNHLKSEIAARGLEGQIHGVLLVGQAPIQIRPGEVNERLSLTTALSTALIAPDEETWETLWLDDSALFRGPIASQAASGVYESTTEIRSDIPFDGQYYWMALHLGYTGVEGLRRDEVFELIDRSVAADGLAPRGTVYWPLNSNVRSEMREGQIDLTTAEWDLLGLDYHVYGGPYGGGGFGVPENKTGAPGSYPPEERLIQGAITGGDNLDIGGAGSIYTPGAIAEHVTSFGGKFGDSTVLRQTALVEWLRAGASGSSGTVQEPFAIARKFPHSRLHSHYYRGATLAEAFYQSVQSPGELLIMGEPLTQPYAKVPVVTIQAPSEGALISGTISLAVTASRPGGVEGDLDLVINGRMVRIGDPNEIVGATRTAGGFEIDTTTLSDGWHELRVIAYGDDEIRPQGFDTVEVTVDNDRGSVTLTGPTNSAFGDTLAYTATPSGLTGISRIELRSLGRGLATLGAGGGLVNLPADAFSDASPNRLFAVAILDSGQEVFSEPLEVAIQASPAPALLEAPTLPGTLAVARYFQDVTTPGFDWKTATPTAVVPIKDRWSLEVQQIDLWPYQGDVEDDPGGVEFVTRLYAEETGLYDFLISGIALFTIEVDGELLYDSINSGVKKPSIFLEQGWHEVRVLSRLPNRNNVNSYSLQPLFRNTQTRKFQPLSGYSIENYAPFDLDNSVAPAVEFTIPQLSVRATGAGEAALSWTDPFSSETGWKVQRYAGDPEVTLASYSGGNTPPMIVPPSSADAMKPKAPTSVEGDGDSFTHVPPLFQTGTRLITSRADAADGGVNTLYEVDVPAGVTVYAIYRTVNNASTPDWMTAQGGWSTYAVPDGSLGKRVESKETSLWYIKSKTITTPTRLALGGAWPRGGPEDAISFVFIKDGGEWEDIVSLPANTTSTTVSGLNAGEERLRVAAEVPPVLTIPSGEVSADLTVETTNGAPTVDAGPDLQVAGTATGVSLKGSATDDALPASPGVLTTNWTKLSGPGTVSFTDVSNVNTTVMVSAPGVYELQLTANDGGLTSADVMVLTVTGGADVNVAPVVDAGEDETVSIAENAVMNGSVSDDGLPAPPGRVIIQWRQRSGPGTASFLNDRDPQTAVNFSAAGEYVLELSGNDGALSNVDTVTITVEASTQTAPVVDAGADQEISINDPATTLSASASDDGLPNPPSTISYKWTRLSGPGTAAIASSASQTTGVTFSGDLQGEHVFVFSASDGALTSSDTVTITIDFDASGNAPPVVSVAPSEAVVFPDSVLVNITATDDGLPDPSAELTTSWEKVSGPGDYFANDFPTEGYTVLAFDQPGEYTMRLNASDGVAITSDTTTIVIQDLTSHRLVWAWGNTQYGVAGPFGNFDFSVGSLSTTPHPVGRAWVKVEPERYGTLAVTKDGRVLASGSEFGGPGLLGEIGVPDRNYFAPIPGLTDVVDIANASDAGAALHFDGTVSTWGSNSFGVLGTGASGPNRETPLPIEGFAEVTALAGSLYSVYAIKEDGSLWAWGYNGNTKLGLGVADSPIWVPTEVPGLTHVKQVDGGFTHTVVLKEDGTVQAAGNNFYGQLGRGTSGSGTNSASFAPVLTSLSPETPLTGIVQVEAGDDFSIARDDDGRVWAWGDNRYGQQGQGNFVNAAPLAKLVLDPDDPTGYLTDVVDIACSEDSVFAVKTDGSLYGWGAGELEELFGPTHGALDRAYPVLISGVPTLTSVWAGEETVFAATAWATYDQWVSETFTAQEIANGMAAPEHDYLGTGISNLLFYAFDENPKTGMAGNPVEVWIDNGLLTVEFESLLPTEDVEIRLLVSTDLKEWTPIDPAAFNSEERGDKIRRSVNFDTNILKESFFRIQVVRN